MPVPLGIVTVFEPLGRTTVAVPATDGAERVTVPEVSPEITSEDMIYSHMIPIVPLL